MEYFILYFQPVEMQFIALRTNETASIETWNDKETALEELAEYRKAGYNAKLAVLLED